MQQKSELSTVRKLWEHIQEEQLNISFDVLPPLEDDLPSLDDITTAKKLLDTVIEEYELPKDLDFEEYQKLFAFIKRFIEADSERDIKYAAYLAAELVAYFQDAKLAIEFLIWYEDHESDTSVSELNTKLKYLPEYQIENAVYIGLRLKSHNFPVKKQVELALSANRWDSCIWLIKNYPIDMNARYGLNQKTIIQIAARHPNPIETIKLLISCGASLTTLSGLGISIQYFAAEAGSLELLQWLDLQQFDMHIKTPYERTLLHAAAEQGHLNVVQWLVEIKRLSVNDVTLDNVSPLHEAVEANRPEIVQYLLAHQASVTTKGKAGRTPIQTAACHYRWAVVAILITLQENKDEKDINGKAILHYAAESADSATMMMLVSHGADVNIQDNHGATPLHYLMRTGKWDVAKILILQCHADTSMKNKAGDTALVRSIQTRLFPPPADLLDLFANKASSEKEIDSILKQGLII